MAKKIFISFNFKHVGHKNDMLRLFAPSGGRIQATPIHVVNDVSKEGEPTIKAEIQRVVAPCSGMVVLVGDDTHNSPWINYEVGYASSQHLPTVAVRHPQSLGGLPNNYKGMKVVEWNSPELADIVRSWPTL